MVKTDINPECYLMLPNSKFRPTNDEASSSFIHDSQINCAKEVISNLLRKKLRRNSLVLSAKMQSGKTGVTTAITNIISTTPLYREMGIDKFFFITGMNDTGLKDQTYTRIINQIIKANIDNTYIGKRSKKNLSKNHFFVLKNSDLMKFEETSLDNSIIFIDEAHYGSNEKNILTKFMNKQNVNWKNTNGLIGRNIYIVSVSATPFDEIYSDTANCKKIVELKPGENYVGVTELLKNNLIYEASSDDISEDGMIFEYIKDAYDRMQEDEIDGVVMIRTTKFETITNNAFVKEHFDVFEMYAASKRIDYQHLNTLMEQLVTRNNFNSKHIVISAVTDCPKISGKPLLVLIKGAFRAGITFEPSFKDYIYMIFDYSLKSETTAQALLGRMCGYRDKDASITRTKFYLNKQFAEMYSNWESNMQDKNALPSNKVKYDWVDNNLDCPEAKLKTKNKGNFIVQLNGDECKAFISCSRLKKDKVSRVNALINTIFAKNHIDCSYDFIGDMYLAGKNTYAKTTQKKRFDSFSEDTLVCHFEPSRLRGFTEVTGRTYLDRSDLGKSAIGIMLDCTNDYYNGVQSIGGNRRLLVYNYELGQQILVPNRKDMYKKHKDTSLI